MTKRTNTIELNYGPSPLKSEADSLDRETSTLRPGRIATLETSATTQVVHTRRTRLKEAARTLRRRFSRIGPDGYLRGKTRLRNALARAQNISQMQAERLVDALEARGFLWFSGDPRTAGGQDAAWIIRDTPRLARIR